MTMPERLWAVAWDADELPGYIAAEYEMQYGGQAQYIRADIAETRRSEQSARIRLFSDAGRRLSKCTDVAQIKHEAAGLFSLIGLNGAPFEAVIVRQQARIKALEDAIRAIVDSDDFLRSTHILKASQLLEQPK